MKKKSIRIRITSYTVARQGRVISTLILPSLHNALFVTYPATSTLLVRELIFFSLFINDH